MKPEVKPFRYCARSLDDGKISIREAVRFEANPEKYVETNGTLK